MDKHLKFINASKNSYFNNKYLKDMNQSIQNYIETNESEPIYKIMRKNN